MQELILFLPSFFGTGVGGGGKTRGKGLQGEEEFSVCSGMTFPTD